MVFLLKSPQNVPIHNFPRHEPVMFRPGPVPRLGQVYPDRGRGGHIPEEYHRGNRGNQPY